MSGFDSDLAGDLQIAEHDDLAAAFQERSKCEPSIKSGPLTMEGILPNSSLCWTRSGRADIKVSTPLSPSSSEKWEISFLRSSARILTVESRGAIRYFPRIGLCRATPESRKSMVSAESDSLPPSFTRTNLSLFKYIPLIPALQSSPNMTASPRMSEGIAGKRLQRKRTLSSGISPSGRIAEESFGFPIIR